MFKTFYLASVLNTFTLKTLASTTICKVVETFTTTRENCLSCDLTQCIPHSPLTMFIAKQYLIQNFNKQQ